MCEILFIIVCVCELKGYNSYKPLTSFDRKLIGYIGSPCTYSVFKSVKSIPGSENLWHLYQLVIGRQEMFLDRGSQTRGNVVITRG